jgi:hypothetical protein
MGDEKLFEMIKVVTPPPPLEAEGEIQMESEEVANPPRPERGESPMVDDSELLDRIEQLCGKVIPEGASDVPQGTSEHSDVSENSSEGDVERVVGETLADAVDQVVEAVENSTLEKKC